MCAELSFRIYGFLCLETSRMLFAGEALKPLAERLDGEAKNIMLEIGRAHV